MLLGSRILFFILTLKILIFCFIFNTLKPIYSHDLTIKKGFINARLLFKDLRNICFLKIKISFFDIAFLLLKRFLNQKSWMHFFIISWVLLARGRELFCTRIHLTNKASLGPFFGLIINYLKNSPIYLYLCLILYYI